MAKKTEEEKEQWRLVAIEREHGPDSEEMEAADDTLTRAERRLRRGMPADERPEL